jgi:hypothetical protein
VLRACRTVLKPGGRLAFYTIFTAPGISDGDRALALRLRPLALSWRDLTVRDLLARAGFGDIRESDLSEEFVRTQRLFLASQTRHAEGLRPLKPPGDFDRDLKSSTKQIPLLERGIIRRALFVARRP